MPRKRTKKDDEQMGAEGCGLRALVVARERRDLVLARLGGATAGWAVYEHVPELSREGALVVIDDASLGGAERAVRRLTTSHGARVVVLCETPDAARVVQLHRSGAVDILLPTDSPEDAAARVAFAAEGADDKDAALRRAGLVREELLAQLGLLCGSLGQTYKGLAAEMQRVALASEVSAMLRQELDLESLLRTVLELLLRRTGPTNAAIFMPSGGGDYSLGAYANYDCPKDTAETMFDELAGVFGPRFELLTSPVVMSDEGEKSRRLGHAAHWLEDAAVLVAPCRDASECRAVLVLFRDRRAAFNESTVRVVGLMAGLAGDQMARVVRTHNRHLPKDKWASPGESAGENDADLAA
ncbi:MAG: GAF domain-containing protein [Phycisphaerales bacterium]